MQKLYRSFLVTSLAVAGLVGCGDDVQITQPEPGIRSVTVAPNGVSINVGGTVQMAAAVTTDPGASGTPTVTWSSSNPATASVDGTGLVTGVAAGSVAITATATLGTSTAQGTATVTVTSVVTTPATVSINAINAGAVPAVLTNVFGQVNVVVNLDRGNESIQKVELLVDGTAVLAQNFGASAGLEASASDIEQLVFPWNTADFTVTNGLGVGKHPNGSHTVSAKVTTAQNATGSVSPSIQLTLNNLNTVSVTTQILNGTSANDGAGLLWSTGDLQATAVPVVYSGGTPTVNQVVLTPTGLNAKALTTAPFTATWAKGTSVGNGGSAGVETAGLVVAAASTVNGATGPNGNSPAINYDNKGPAAPVIGPMTIWVNSAFQFKPGTGTGVTLGADGGVGGVMATFWFSTATLPTSACSTTGLTAITQANDTDLPGTIVSTVYNGRVVTFDLLNNQTCANLANPFGADYIAPTGTIAGPADGSAANAVGAAFTFTVTDNASGFGATPLSGIIKRLNTTASAFCVFGSGTGCSTPGTSPLTLDAYNGLNVDGYYTFDPITVSDQAANAVTFTGRTYLLDQVAAAFSGGLSLQALYVGGATATFNTQATDNLDINNVFGVLTYPTGSIQYPTQAIGTFGAPLTTASAVNLSISNFLRCLNPANDFATTTNAAASVDLFLSDFAQAAPTAFGATLIPAANVETCDAVGNVAGIISFNQNAPNYGTGKTQVDISGTNLATASSSTVTLSAVADVPLNTSLDPFTAVTFYYQNAGGNWVQVGTGSATLQQTPTQRLWTYTFVWDPDAAVPVGAVNVVAIGADSHGDAVFSTGQVVTTVP